MNGRTRFEAWLARHGYTVPACNCGGPQYGTDHSPDCEWELGAQELWDEFCDEIAACEHRGPRQMIGDDYWVCLNCGARGVQAHADRERS